MDRRVLAAVCVLGLFLSGCGGDSGKADAKSSSPSAPPTEKASSAPVASDKGSRLGGGTSGIALELPNGWKEIDPTADTSEVVRNSYGLTGERGELTRQLIAIQRQRGTVYAIDGSVTSGLAPHLSAGCDSGGITGSSLEQLKRKQQALEPGSRITDVTVSGKPAYKATYSSAKEGGPAVDGLTVRVPISADRYCFLQIEAAKGGLPAQAGKIAESFELA
ncbi:MULTISPECIES: hypothetical protein [unclassified Actinomadura]|uniref:hypothetical protein n=1 Tax=unclassified Actinomadura TaxID=2626254 RepID=UPI0011ED733C|nr:hypothetical protein [Actinomadura sp. K4S16]